MDLPPNSDGLIPLDSVPDLSMETVHALFAEHISASQVDLIGSFQFGRDLVDSAQGAYIRLKSGREILDLTGGVGVLNHGHNHPRILQARVNYQAQKRMEVHKNYFSPYLAALSSNVAHLMPGDLNVSYFPNSGAEAVEGAVKMAFKYHDARRETILHSDISFHGKLLGAASITGSPEASYPFPGISGTASFRYGDIESVLRCVQEHRKPDGSSDVYALIFEPLNASSMQIADGLFLEQLRAICDKNGIVLIFDEVYTGWGKTGSTFFFTRVSDVVPDIVTYAKSFGGGKSSISGYTARSCIARQAYGDAASATLHSTTYFGFGEEAATAMAALEVFVDERFNERALAIENDFLPRLRQLSTRHAKRLRGFSGAGGLWGLYLTGSYSPKIGALIARTPFGSYYRDPRKIDQILAAAVVNRLYEEHGLLTFFGSNVMTPLVVSFPLVAGHKEVERAIGALDEVLGVSEFTLIADLIRSRRSRPKVRFAD